MPAHSRFHSVLDKAAAHSQRARVPMGVTLHQFVAVLVRMGDVADVQLD